MRLKFVAIGKDLDINKAVRQHLEMDAFFTGGFAVKSKAKA